MKFKEIYAYRIGPTGKTDTNLVKHLLTETSVCSLSPLRNEDDHFLMELTNRVSLKVPGDIEKIRSYLEDNEEGLDG